jgi:hypothetical protein
MRVLFSIPIDVVIVVIDVACRLVTVAVVVDISGRLGLRPCTFEGLQ